MNFTKFVEIGGNTCAVEADGKTRRRAEWFGDSTRLKPTRAEGARDGDVLFESDTKKVYAFNENAGSWGEV